MGVAADLGDRHEPINGFQRLMQRFGSTRVGAWFFSKTLTTLDRAFLKLSKGRTSVPEVLAGLPVVFVTTTGRKSGEPRSAPLISVPVGDSLALIGTNFGQARTPGWVFNLEADPSARVRYRDVELAATVRPATDDERAAVWQAASAVYPGYDKYQQRITGRDIRIFVLEPAGTGPVD
jgi:deazaflavin-dependent oxidoreductase (nitroreductase family)